MKYSYNFHRNEDVISTGQVTRRVDTFINGDEVNLPLEVVLSGVENFISSCDFELNGSGIGLVDKN